MLLKRSRSHLRRKGAHASGQAGELLDEALDIDGDRLKAEKDFVKKAKRKMPETTVVRYMQLEHKFKAVIDYELARAIPLVQ